MEVQATYLKMEFKLMVPSEVRKKWVKPSKLEVWRTADGERHIRVFAKVGEEILQPRLLSDIPRRDKRRIGSSAVPEDTPADVEAAPVNAAGVSVGDGEEDDDGTSLGPNGEAVYFGSMERQYMREADLTYFPHICAAGDACEMGGHVQVGPIAVQGARCNRCMGIYHDLCVDNSEDARERGWVCSWCLKKGDTAEGASRIRRPEKRQKTNNNGEGGVCVANDQPLRLIAHFVLRTLCATHR
jgi:hypothetical protein